MKMRYQVGGDYFATKKQVSERAKSILNAGGLGDLRGQELDFMLDLLRWHPESEKKIGNGVSSIQVRQNFEPSPHRGFWIVRNDGTETDFSYRNCINSGMAHKLKFKSACRFAIDHHIKRFKQQFFSEAVNPCCPILGTPLNEKNCHVDHAPPYTFNRIVSAFCDLNGLDVNDPSLCVNGQDGILIPWFKDEVLRDRFVQFHNNTAQLRVVSKEANLKVIGKATDGLRKQTA